MTPLRGRLKSPEEIELDRKREDLSRVQAQLASAERDYSSLKQEIRMFEQVYEHILGSRITELEDLEWQLNGLVGEADKTSVTPESSEDAETFAHFQHTTDLLDDDGDYVAPTSRKSLKTLYREVAKAIHPDLAPDEEERYRRQELMAEANRAYEVGDRLVLEKLLEEWEQDQEPELLTGFDIALELVRVIRLIARVRQNILATKRQIEELKGTDIYLFKHRVDEALADGIDLMAEMAATVDMNIARAKKRLTVLRGDTHQQQEDRNVTPPETRIIRFPADYSCGALFVRNAGSVDYREWQRLGNARGVREIFLDKAVRLDVKGSSDSEICFLESLGASDLQSLFLYEIDDSALAHIIHLSGLQELYLSNTTVSNSGLRQLASLDGLRRLYIYHTDISDDGLVNLALIPGLTWLTCSGTNITEAGLQRFRLVMPGCKAVSFKWRYGK